ncbi:hypothetical protein SXCC_02543 [Gluconacetobacter sp. SXCC-1]|nr:hypothetical protein SXCC_02543 [Gluconacetobacter sp. SXCC-1]
MLQVTPPFPSRGAPKTCYSFFRHIAWEYTLPLPGLFAACTIFPYNPSIMA